MIQDDWHLWKDYPLGKIQLAQHILAHYGLTYHHSHLYLQSSSQRMFKLIGSEAGKCIFVQIGCTCAALTRGLMADALGKPDAACGR